MSKVKAAIIGSGNIGSDLMLKIKRLSERMEIVALVGIDPESDGLKRAARQGLHAISTGVDGLIALPEFNEIHIIFDATSAKAHVANASKLEAYGKYLIDLTPAAIGPFHVPAVNGKPQHNARNVNMVTCGGQATIPIVAAVSSVSKVLYAEIVASIASKSAGPGTRENIDEFTETTSKALVEVGGAQKGKALIILNPAEPPLIMRDTVYVLSEGGNTHEIEKAVEAMVATVQSYVPGYRLKQKVQFERFSDDAPASLPGYGSFSGVKTTVFLEVEGAGHYLPSYAGNLDIMTSAAMATGDMIAESIRG